MHALEGSQKVDLLLSQGTGNWQPGTASRVCRPDGLETEIWGPGQGSDAATTRCLLALGTLDALGKAEAAVVRVMVVFGSGAEKDHFHFFET